MLRGSSLYVDRDSAAKRQAEEWRETRPSDATLIDKIAAKPQAVWLNGPNAFQKAREVMNAAAGRNEMAVFVAYNIPNRDMGNHSAGGASDEESYLRWIDGLCGAIAGRCATVILEPDAIAHIEEDVKDAANGRYTLLSESIDRLKRSGALVYLDAGHAAWRPCDQIAARLDKAGVRKSDGFALNVSNFVDTQQNIRYGTQVSAALGDKPFVIDTSRNGRGPHEDGIWCNPPGRALGEPPTTETRVDLVDAYLWIKRPGESDGRCNGGPNAGEWWPDYALDLARLAAW